MNAFHSVILGAVQGLTEFLPVSSSGHLVLFQKIFNIGEEALAFDIAMHVATLAAVAAVFWKEIWHMVRHPFSKITLLVIIATIPTAIVGFAFRGFFEYAFSSAAFLGPCFILTGVILFMADRSRERIHYGKDLDSMSYMDAIFVGLAQSVAIIPAISRSGSTISAGLFRGLKKEFAIKFSFLMSVPAIIGPALFDAKNMTAQMLNDVGIFPLILGMLAAGIAGYFSIRFMLDFFSRASLKVFSYYVFALGGFIILDKLFFKIIF
jgi:undecaprenyl-diphosphatase